MLLVLVAQLLSQILKLHRASVHFQDASHVGLSYFDINDRIKSDRSSNVNFSKQAPALAGETGEKVRRLTSSSSCTKRSCTSPAPFHKSKDVKSERRCALVSSCLCVCVSLSLPLSIYISLSVLTGTQVTQASYHFTWLVFLAKTLLAMLPCKSSDAPHAVLSQTSVWYD